MAKKRSSVQPETTSEILRAAVYVRQSVTSKKSVSVDFQEAELLREVEHRRWQFDAAKDLYIDEGYSGSKEDVKRPAFERMMEAVAAGRYQRIVVWKLDRFSRRPAELQVSLEFMKKHRCHLVSLKDSIDSSTQSGRLIISVAAAVASIEVENTALRVLSTQKKLTDAGRWAGGPAPYGYALEKTEDGKGTRLVLVEEEANVIRKAAQLIVEHNHGIGSAAKWLNAHGYTSGRERPWSPQALGTVLRRRTLVGQHGRGLNIATDEKTGRPLILNEPVLNVRLYSALQRRLDELGQHRTKEAGSGALLAGVLRCGRCGGLLHGTDSERSPKGNYRCRLRYDLNGDCKGVSILAKNVEQLVAEQVVQRLGEEGNIPQTADEWQAGLVALVDEDLEQAQRLVRGDMVRMQNERIDGKWNYPQGSEDWTRIYDGLIRQSNDLAAKAARAVAASPLPPSPYFPWKDAGEVLRTWRRLEQQDRRRTVAQLIKSVVVHPVDAPERVVIEWRTDVFHRPEDVPSPGRPAKKRQSPRA